MSEPRIKPQIIPLSQFIAAAPDFADFIAESDRGLTANGYKQKIENKASGLTATYLHPKPKKILIQLYFKKSVLHMYIYGAFFDEYNGRLDKLPPRIASEIDTLSDCKWLHNPGSCNPLCPKGYEFTASGTVHKKCMFGRISLALDSEIAELAAVLQEPIKRQNFS